MNEEKDVLLSGDIKELDGEELEEDVAHCFGEYGKHSRCEACYLRKKCKKFTEAEKTVTLRSKGKYGIRGKEKRKDRY